MVTRTNISNTITELDTLYTNNPSQSIYFSKLALIELCGWIEQTMDDIVTDHATSMLVDQKNISFVQNQIVKRTYGFHYEDNFRGMLMRLIGLIELERVETSLSAGGDLAILQAQLNILKSKRNDAAHTAISGVMITYDSPSIILANLNTIYPILIKIENELIGLRNIASRTTAITSNPTLGTTKGCYSLLFIAGIFFLSTLLLFFLL